MNEPTVKTAFQDTWALLKDAGIESARLDARLLVGLILGGGAERVLAESGRVLTTEEENRLAGLVRRRQGREPMSHILGRREFWSLEFKVTAATLTPRSDTETVVETTLAHAPADVKRVLDLGTGSGCILLALMSEWPNASGVGVDASAEALAVARDNADSLGMARRTRFVRADWTRRDWRVGLGGPFDVIVSNPPYIPAGDIAGLEADVRDFEPRAALAGGVDGLDAYRAIIPELDALLASGGVCVVEVGAGQAEAVEELFRGAGLSVVDKRGDLAGIERALCARKENHAP